MKTFPDSYSKNYADWSALGWAMFLGHAPASPDTKPNGKAALPPAEQGWEQEGGSLKEKAPKKAEAASKPALRKAPAKKRPAKKAKKAKRSKRK